MIRIQLKSNVNVIKIGVKNINYYIQYFQAHIMDDSREFQTFELPFQNFIQTSDFFSRYINPYSEKLKRLHIKELILVVESLIDKDFEIELISIEIFSSNSKKDLYKNYSLPFFKVVNNRI